MRAMVVTQSGPPEVLQMAELPDPVPGEHDLLVEVHATSVNPVDFKARRGAFAQGRSFPYVLGYDVSGVVRGMGAQVRGFTLGDEVYACPSIVRNGADAEYVCVDARTAAHKPRTLDHAQAAAMPLVTLTAWEALYDRVRVQAGESVLIHAGGGGVGHIAIQLALLRGCRVLTTAGRPESLELCRALGAQVVINYHQEDFVEVAKRQTGGRGCPVVFDLVGFEVFDRSPLCLAVDGRMVSVVGTKTPEAFRELFVRNATLHMEFVGSATMHGVRLESQGAILRAAAELVDSGRLKGHVSHVLDLADLAEGHRLVESGHTTGKIAVRVKP